MMHETQESISQWAMETFGPSGSDARVAARANEEMAEVLRKVTADVMGEAVVEECADVVIVLFRLASRNGYDLLDMIDKKMAINRQRVWAQDGTGHGYHVRGK